MPSSTSCPVAGTGCDKVFTDVERLCNVHIPQWLASDGMDADKIAAFYADPVKRACDEWSAAKAFDFRSVSIATSPYWTAQRWARFMAWSSSGTIAAAGRSVPSGAELPRSLLLVVLIILVEVVFILVVFVIIAVVVGLSRRAMRLVDLVVPQLAIGAVLGEQLGMRAALDRPAP